jgi:hypothetical protein
MNTTWWGEETQINQGKAAAPTLMKTEQAWSGLYLAAAAADGDIFRKN